VILDADPLHVAAMVGPAGAQRDDVIDVEAGAGPAVLQRRWTGVQSAESADFGAVTRGCGKQREQS
jgi:hypothetical protein